MKWAIPSNAIQPKGLILEEIFCIRGMLSLGNLNSSSKAAVFKTLSDASLQFYGKMVRDYNMNSI